jgi:hypothetical protein
MMSQTTVVHNAAVLTLDSKPVTLIPAPPNGTVTLPLYVLLQQKGSPTYTCGCTLSFYLGANDTFEWGSIYNSGAANLLLNGTGFFNSGTINGDASAYVGKPFTVQATSPITGTGGDLVFTVYYFQLALP